MRIGRSHYDVRDDLDALLDEERHPPAAAKSNPGAPPEREPDLITADIMQRALTLFAGAKKPTPPDDIA